MDPIREALYATLAVDTELGTLATGGIWHRTADQEAAAPYVTFHKEAGPRRKTFKGPDLRPQLWLVKGVCRGDAEEAENIDARIEEILDGAEIEADGALVLGVVREDDVDYGETDHGENVHHVGARYRIWSERA